jgi:hypothetical protein
MLCKHFHWNWIMLCLHLILFSFYQIDIQLNFFSLNVSHLNWHFGVIGLPITFWIFFSFSSFGTMILLLWFLIFKLLSILKPNDFFIFSLSSDFNFLTKFSGIDFFYFCLFWYPVPFLIQSIKYSLIINKGIIVFVFS